MDTYRDWSKPGLGYWKEQGPAYGEEPSIEGFIDTEWNPEDKSQIVKYLLSAEIVAATSAMAFPCVICKQKFHGSVCKRTDGRFYWLDALAHYVDKHHLRLPEGMLKYMRQLQFAPPKIADPSSVVAKLRKS